MSLVGDTLDWFGDPSHWSGSGGIPNRLVEHLAYSGQALVLAAVIAVPIGLAIGHTGRGSFLIVGLANGFRALPELGLLTLLVLAVGIGLLPVIVALAVLGVPALLAGAYSGVRNVDRSVVDAARGMGMRGPQVLFRVELPNALPLLLGGLRAAALQIVATTTVAAYVSFGGFGRYLIDGLSVRDYAQMTAGAVLVAVLALTIEGLLALVQRQVVSPGLRAGGGGRRSSAVDTAVDTGGPTTEEPPDSTRAPDALEVAQ